MPATIKIVINADSAGKGFEDTKKSLRDLDDSARKAGGGFDALTGMVAGATAAVTGAVLNMAAQGAQALAGFVGDSISAAGTFEAAVNGLAAVSGDALSQAGLSLDDVSAKALQLGKDTQFSAQEAIQAMTELAKGGVPIQSVMTDATDATLALAAAAGVALPNAAEIVAKQLGVWSEEGVTAAQVTDLLASAANASTVGVEDLALGLAQAGGTAKTAGVEFGDLVQTMALIAPNFSSASDAGTSLKTFLSRLIPTTNAAKSAMADLGLMAFDTAKAMEILKTKGFTGTESVDQMAAAIENVGVEMGLSGKKLEEFMTGFSGSAFFDAQGSFVGMEEAARLLQVATADLSEEEKLLAFNTIFGSDAIRAAAAIANAGAEGYSAMGASMEASGGAAAAAAIKQQGYAFAMEQLQGSVETAQIILGSAFLPILTDVVGKFTEGVNAVANFADRFKNIPAAIAESDDPIRTFLASLAIMFPEIGKVVHQIIAWYDSSKPLIEQLQVQIPAAIAVVSAFWNGVLLPALQAVWTFITGTAIPKLSELWTWLSTTLPPAIATLSTFWETTLLPALQTVWAFITDTAIPKLTELYNWIATNLPPVIQTLSDMWNNTLLPALTATWEFIDSTLLPIIRDLSAFLADQMKPEVERAKAAFDAFWSFLQSNFVPIVKTLITQLGLTPGPIKSVLEASNQAKTGFEGWKSAINGLVSAFKSLASAINNLPKPPAWMGNTGGLVGGIGGGLGTQAGNAIAGRASGGPVSSGTPYMVGERGPELFVPSQSGNIVPNGGRTTNNTFNMTVNTNAKASTVASDFGMMKALAGVR